MRITSVIFLKQIFFFFLKISITLLSIYKDISAIVNINAENLRNIKRIQINVYVNINSIKCQINQDNHMTLN